MRKAILVLAVALVPLLASTQVHKAWVKTWGGTDSYCLGRGIAVDDSGNIYVAGNTSVSGSYAGVIVKYATDGRYLWDRILSATPSAVVADKFGVYVTSTLYTGSHGHMVTTKICPNGDYGWSNWYDLWLGAGGSDIVVDSHSNVYVSGWGRVSDSANGYRTVVVKYSGSGQKEWDVVDSVKTYIERVALAVDDRGVYICTPVRGVTFLACYSLDGIPRWSKRHGMFGAYSPAISGDIALDKEGKVYFTSSIAQDTLKQTDLLVGAYTSDGGFLWQDTWECSADGMSAGVAMAVDDSTGSIFVTGAYFPDRKGTIKRAVTMKYTTGGGQSWIRTYQGAGGWDRFYDVAADHHGNAYVAGFTDIGQPAAGSENILMKYGPGGGVEWSDTYMITGGDDVWVGVVVDRAQNVYVGGSITTTWSPYTILLATAKYSQKGRFKPDRDGWKFDNSAANMWPQAWWSQFDYTKPPYPFFLSWPPINATSADFPDWPLFVNVYGVEQCYKKVGDGSYYFVPTALLRWRSMVGSMKARDNAGKITSHWNGSCAGFSLSALLYYNDMLSLQWTLGNYDTVYSVPISDDSRYLVNKHYVTYVGNFKPEELPTGPQVLSELKTMLVDNYTNDGVVGFMDAVTGAAHAVVACSLAAIGSGWWELPIYDPNYPGTYMHLNYSEITEEWSAQEQGWNNLLPWLISAGSFSQTPILPLAATAAASPGSSPDSSTSVFNSPYVDIRIRNAIGQTTGYAKGALIDSMPGAQPRINLGANVVPPGGYFLPPGEYTAQIGESRDSTTYFAIFLESAAFSFHREGAKSGDNEILRFSTEAKSLSVTNPDLGSKSLFVQSIESLSGEETVCRLHVRAMPPADSLAVQLVGDRNVALLVGSGGMTADLRLELVKDFSNPVFEYAALALEGGVSYLVAPVWDSLATIPLRIYVDHDRDGTVDDTLRLENQATAVPSGRSELIPDKFRLHQNYPNPFNPATTITYELPTSSDVRLMVYDLLGREVRMLVSERKPAGVHNVRFDASTLASGVYIYRLQARPTDGVLAGTFVQSRKLLLLR
jgi:hypothetical protein